LELGREILPHNDRKFVNDLLDLTMFYMEWLFDYTLRDDGLL
jgi:hypothetical protein